MRFQGLGVSQRGDTRRRRRAVGRELEGAVEVVTKNRAYGRNERQLRTGLEGARGGPVARGKVRSSKQTRTTNDPTSSGATQAGVGDLYIISRTPLTRATQTVTGIHRALSARGLYGREGDHPAWIDRGEASSRSWIVDGTRGRGRGCVEVEACE